MSSISEKRITELEDAVRDIEHRLKYLESKLIPPKTGSPYDAGIWHKVRKSTRL